MLTALIRIRPDHGAYTRLKARQRRGSELEFIRCHEQGFLDEELVLDI
jgi:hypothetical protein